MRLTDISLQKLKPQDKQTVYYDDSLPNFGIRVGKKTKTFIIKVGEARSIKSLGRYPEMTLKTARLRAKKYLISPYEKRSMRYTEAVADFLEEAETRNRPKTVSEYKRYLEAYTGRKSVNELNRQDMKKILSRYTTPSSYKHAVVAFKIFFNWCLRNELTENNPVSGVRVAASKPRERVLLPEEIQQVWAYDFPPFSTILKLCLLTGQRRTEIASIVPEWIKDGMLTIPSEITKNKRRHTIPVSEQVQELCLQSPFGRHGAFNGWSRAKMMIDKVVDIPHWTIHDLRRTFSTIHAEIGTPIHITERLLNHASGSTGGIVGIYNKYQYLDEMREAQEKYETILTNIVTS